jgi:hypothetical protein
MSTAPTGVVVPTKGGEVQPGAAAAATKMSGGGLVLTPLPLNGGKRKSRKVSKKVIKMLKKMSRKQLKKLMKGGVDETGTETTETTPSTETTGAGKKKTRKNRKSRKHSLLY